MIDKVQVIDNALPIDLFEKLEWMVYNELTWNLAFTTKLNGSYSLASMVFDQKSIMTNVFYESAEFIKSKISAKKILRIRPAAIFRDIDYTIHTPHVDNYLPHLVALLYINDSDGDTFIYKDEGEEILQRVTPKRNRIVLFDGSLYHSSSTPVENQIRINVNYNFEL